MKVFQESFDESIRNLVPCFKDFDLIKKSITDRKEKISILETNIEDNKSTSKSYIINRGDNATVNNRTLDRP